MTWKMREETEQRLRRHAVLRARRESRSGLSSRLDARSISYSLLADATQDELVAAVLAQPKGEERAFELAMQAMRATRTVTSIHLPELSIFGGWSIHEDAAVLLRLSDGLSLLEEDFEFFSPDGCMIASPDGATGAFFDFDAPPECCPGYLHLFGANWPSGLLARME